MLAGKSYLTNSRIAGNWRHCNDPRLCQREHRSSGDTMMRRTWWGYYPGIISHAFEYRLPLRVSDLHMSGVEKTTWEGDNSWWRHQMETFSALLAICAGNSPVSGEFPAQRPVTRSFDIFFDLRMDGRLSKHSWCWWLETLACPLWRQSNGCSPRQHAPFGHPEYSSRTKSVKHLEYKWNISV